MAPTVKPKPTIVPEDPKLQEMMEAGLHFGHKTSKTHPKMLPYVTGVRGTVHIIDVAATRVKLDEMKEELRSLREQGKVILFVGTKVQVKRVVRELAERLGAPFVAERWIGGTLTNFETIHKRVERLRELEQESGTEEWNKYTKKERAELERERAVLEAKFGGVKELDKVPDALFVFDLDENQLAVREAKRKGIPVYAVADTNVNPEVAERVIPANDDAVPALAYIAQELASALEGVVEVKQEENPEQEPKPEE